MATENNKSKWSSAPKSKKGKTRYLPHNRSVKKKGSYPLHPGVEGFFITCDGGRERQASHEALNVIDSFFEELVQGKDSGINLSEAPSKPLNKKIKFTYSDSSSSDDDNDDDNKEEGETEEPVEDKEVVKGENKSDTCRDDDGSHDNQISETSDLEKKDNALSENKPEEDTKDDKEGSISKEISAKEGEEPPAKKQCLGTDSSKRIPDKVEEKSIDKLIEDELQELKDKNKRRFVNLESGCNGVVFVQMRKRDGDPGPKDIVQHMMTSAAATRKHMSRFILRVLPVEVSCYASEEEISRAIKPLLAQYFPLETQSPRKFAVLYGARANTGIDRMKIIDAVAKSVPEPHKVDLSNPDLNIVVEICKTICLIGVVENYKQLAKYNLRQLTSPKP
ncbi:putative THUMP domain-containing protein [Rosa chinensis]|uniref:Putative THUMP domain-containing protein n=1 Tax=Rosa chinensis TaxID=74649 RepID=A0A2P6QFB3_ROSCH|nr:THUMP domain-containing protein 1 homolog [Rosa chinensis]PRQ32870.1 putative THUMP domain-containing protein [Rosa chinensis]